jgi:hypothetical protein
MESIEVGVHGQEGLLPQRLLDFPFHALLLQRRFGLQRALLHRLAAADCPLM